MEKFNPYNPEYKKVDDLPKDEQEKFININDGFVEKTALEAWEFWEAEAKKSNNERGVFKKILNIDKQKAIDLARHEADLLNVIFNNKRAEDIERNKNINEAKSEIKKLEWIIEQWLEVIAKSNFGWIRDGEIGTIVSEDRSGRFPAEIILSAINKIYKEHGRSEIKITPLDTGRGNTDGELNYAQIKDMFSDLISKGEISKSILYVTEYIAEGNTIKRAVKGITNAIKEFGAHIPSKMIDRGGTIAEKSEIGLIIAPLCRFNSLKMLQLIAGEDRSGMKYLHGFVKVERSEDMTETFRKYSGLARQLTSEEQEAKNAFIEEVSDRFVQMYKNSQR